MKTVVARNNVFNEAVTPDLLGRAIARGKEANKSSIHASSVRYLSQSKALEIAFADESAVLLPLKNYAEFSDLSATQLGKLEIGFAGTAICLSEKDLHVSIAGLISASEPLMEMASSAVASCNGRKSSLLKAAAARQNGLRGGRPKKVVEVA